MHLCFRSACFLILAITLSARAVPTRANDAAVYEITPPQRLALRQLEQLIATGEAAAAVELAVRIIDESDGRLISLDNASQSLAETFLPLSAAVHDSLLRSASDDRSVLQAYRQRYDRIAETQLRLATDSRSIASIQRWLNRYFATSSGDEALLALADLGLQEGHVQVAIAALLRIDSLAAEVIPPSQLPVGCYIGSDIPGGQVGVRMVYALRLSGESAKAAEWAALVRERFAGQSIVVAGLEGTVADRLDWLDQAFSSSSQADSGISLRGGSPAWTHVVPPVEALSSDLAPAWSRRGERLRDSAIVPLLADEKVFLHTGRAVFARSLASGQPWPPGIADQALYTAADPNKPLWPAARPLDALPRYSLFCQGRWLAGRFGAVADFQVDSGQQLAASQIVVLDLEREGALQSGYPVTAPANSRFSSPPLLTSSRLFVAVEHRDEATVTTRLMCLDLPSAAPLWSSPPIAVARHRREQARARQVALAIDHNLLVCHIDGVTAAVDTHQGSLRWVLRHAVAELADSPYPRPRKSAERSVSTLHVSHGQVVVAGIDIDRIVCVDTQSGRVQWATAAGVADDVQHLLGVTTDHWVAAGQRLYWLNRHNGAVQAVFPQGSTAQLGAASSGPHGTGLGWLSSQYVYWPTRDAIWILDAAPSKALGRGGVPPQPRMVGQIMLRPFGLQGGNLAAAYDVLVNVGSDYVSGFPDRATPSSPPQ